MKTLSVATLAAFAVVLALSSCTKREQKAQPSTPPRAKAPEIQVVPETGPFVVMGHLQHRDRIVTVKSGPSGRVYSVQTADGTLLFENLTAEQLKTESPQIHDFIEGATVHGHADLLSIESPGRDLLMMTR
ncbi:MAG TPA: hypothetical protein VFE29_07045 [Terriglobia bacterium]|nr:hypothetical protein [Terriglobia bacterium]